MSSSVTFLSLLHMLQALQMLVLWFPLLLTLSVFLPVSASPVSSFVLILSHCWHLYLDCLLSSVWSTISLSDQGRAVYSLRKPVIWTERTSFMIIPRRLISPRQQTTHCGALFSFTTKCLPNCMLRQEGWIERIQHSLKLVSENHQRLREP